MFYVYILTNKRNGTLYIGHTDDLMKRVDEHKRDVFEGFAAKHGCKMLVWYELHDSRDSAFRRERQMKKWNRVWKIRRIEDLNPDWRDLSEDITLDDLYGDERKFPSDLKLRKSGFPPVRE